MFSPTSETEKADLLGERLVGGATETASVFMEELGKRFSIGFRDSNSAPQFIIEVIVFYMHLVDRLAFAHLGFVKRKQFGDRFVVVVVKGFLQEMSRDMSADTLRTALRDTYNRRQTEYVKYKVLMPEKGGPLKDTLYWEFSKVLFGFLDDKNPATLIFLNVLVSDFTNLMLNDVLKVEEVLTSSGGGITSESNMQNKTGDSNPSSAWTDEGIERMRKLKKAQMEGGFGEAFDEMFPKATKPSEPQEFPTGRSSKPIFTSKSDHEAKHFFGSEEETWAYIEEQEAMLNQVEDIFAKVRKKPKPHEGLAECPTPFKETERLAKDGDPISQFNLSIAYSNGDGVSRDADKAAYWLLESAENGFAPAQYNTGCYWRDKSDPNHQEAYSWFKKAAEQNYGPAQFNLGILSGNAGNYAAAYVWLYLAEQNRVEKAKENREKAASLLSKEDLNAAQLSVSAWMARFRRQGDRTHVESE